MTEARTDPWTQVGVAFLVGVSVVVLSWLTAILQRSPIHSDSWGPTLVVWGVGPVVGGILLVYRQRSWAVVCIVGTLVGVVGFVATLVAYLVMNGA